MKINFDYSDKKEILKDFKYIDLKAKKLLEKIGNSKFHSFIKEKNLFNDAFNLYLINYFFIINYFIFFKNSANFQKLLFIC